MICLFSPNGVLPSLVLPSYPYKMVVMSPKIEKENYWGSKSYLYRTLLTCGIYRTLHVPLFTRKLFLHSVILLSIIIINVFSLRCPIVVYCLVLMVIHLLCMRRYLI